ncbi:MAG: hypothetical protein RI906_2585 [Pseudomonadota bacterium]|jgi:cytochrome c-type biogenesis protein CcmH
MLLWSIVVLLTLAVTVAMVWPLLSRKLPQGSDADEDRLIAVFRDRAGEIERERDAGRLSAQEAQAALDALVEQMSGELSEDTTRKPEIGGSPGRTPRSVFGAVLVMVFVPIAAILVYQKLGSPHLTDDDGQWSQQWLDPARIEAMITDLKDRVARSPDDGEAWALLAGAHKFRGEHPQAIQAFERASALLPPNARLLAEFAESIALTQDNRFAGRPIDLLERALAADADEPKAIALMGAAQYQVGNLPRARQYLGRLHAEMPSDMPERQAIGDVLARIDRELGATAPTAKDAPPAQPLAANASPTQPGASSASAAQPGISGTISLTPEMVARAQTPFTLFVVARAEQGPRIPLAVLRVDNPTLPFNFQLDNRHAMDPSRTISSTERLLVEARLSRDGNAMRQPGDLTSDSLAVSAGTHGVRIVIDREVGR